MSNLAQLADHFRGVGFRAGALRITIATIDPFGTAQIVIDNAANTGVRRAVVAMRVMGSEDMFIEGAVSAPSHTLPILILYPARRRHPLGHQAPSSWLNEAGDGLLAVSQEGLLIHAMVTGV